MAHIVSSVIIVVDVTIPNGTADSNAIKFKDGFVIGVEFPAAWTAANLGFEVSSDEGTTYVDTYDDDGEIRKDQAGASRTILFLNRPVPIPGYIRAKSIANADGADVNQAADRVLKLYISP
jgi:hypothetical protein